MIGTSITVSIGNNIPVCPGGRVLLTCERISGSFLHWNVSIPHLTTREAIITNQRAFYSIDPLLTGLHYATFTITRISVNPLTSQMLINNVTTKINGSTIYCSEDGNENGAPMVTVLFTNELIYSFLIFYRPFFQCYLGESVVNN